MRFPIVATLVALTGIAGLAAATVPLSPLETATLLPVETPALPALDTPVAADLVDAREVLLAPRLDAPVSPAAPAPAIPLLAPEAPVPASTSAPVLLLPDGFAFLAPGAPSNLAGLRLDTSALPVAAPALPEAPLVETPLAAPEAPRADAPAPLAPAATPVEESTAAASHAYVASPASGRVVAAAAAGAAVALLGVAGLALYHRISPHATLENDTRKVIFEAVCASPGLGVHAISEKAGVSYSTTTYHLERLVAAGMIVMTPDGNKLCYYKNGGAFTETERRILPLVKNDEASRLLEAILDTPGTYRAALAERLGVTATTINWHLRRLREAGLIEELRQGRNAYLHVRLGAVRESFLPLASKVEPTDPAAAARLRRFADIGGVVPQAA